MDVNPPAVPRGLEVIRRAVVAAAAILEATAAARTTCLAGLARLAGALRARIEATCGAILADALVVGVAAGHHLLRYTGRFRWL